MELKHVRIFTLAAKYLNFTKVAEVAFISQSSVSKYIHVLEEELGGALFIRDGRRTELSDLGQIFLPHAISMLEQEKQTQKAIRRFKEASSRTTLSIGIDDDLCVAPPETFFIPMARTINTIRRQHRDEVEFSIAYMKTAECRRMLKSGQIDVWLQLQNSEQAQIRHEGLEAFCLDTDKNFLAVSDDVDTSIGYKEVMQQMDVYALDGLSMPSNLTALLISEYHIDPEVQIFNSWTEMYIQIMTAEGNLAAIFPENMVHIARAAGMKILPMDDFPLLSGLYAIYREETQNVWLDIFLEEMYARLREPKQNIPDDCMINTL